MYQHHSTRASDFVVRDMMICFGKALRWKEKIESGPEGFFEITDALTYGLAASSNVPGTGLMLEDSTPEERQWMERGRRIARNRLLSRRWYRQVNVADLQKTDHIIIEQCKSVLGYSYNDQNPLDKIYYYKQHTPNERFLIPAKDRSHMISAEFSEILISYYTPPPGDEDIDQVIQELLKAAKDRLSNINTSTAVEEIIRPQRLSGNKRRYISYSSALQHSLQQQTNNSEISDRTRSATIQNSYHKKLRNH
jgi:hypothetical protein